MVSTRLTPSFQRRRCHRWPADVASSCRLILGRRWPPSSSASLAGRPSADILPVDAVREAAAKGPCRRLEARALLRDRHRASRPVRVDRRAPRPRRSRPGDGDQRVARGGGDCSSSSSSAPAIGSSSSSLRTTARCCSWSGSAPIGSACRSRPTASTWRSSSASSARAPGEARPRDPELPQPGRMHALRREARATGRAGAAEHGFWILEDDPYRELPFDEDPPPTMLSPGDDGRVIHASSFSKTVSPGVRVGYLAGPADEIAQLAKRANEIYISPNMLAESIVYELCRSGALDREHRVREGALLASAVTRSSRPWASTSPRPSSSFPEAVTSCGSRSARTWTQPSCCPPRSRRGSRSSLGRTSCSRAAARA